jgi:hypothetical protein
MPSNPNLFFRWRRIFARSIFALAGLYLLLLIPASEPPLPKGANKTPFAWNQSQFWSALENRFKQARVEGCGQLTTQINSLSASTEQLLASIDSEPLRPADSKFSALETNLFQLTPLIAACPEHLPDFIQHYTHLRELLKHQSQHWDMNAPEGRVRIYRLLYGGRAALEEIMLQAPRQAVPALVAAPDEPSAAPSANALGVAIHSGDVLVSRGGAPTSALIARGNDYPGNFSHVALVHVDERTHAASVIESHIEKGVAVTSFPDYLKDKKLRIMVLRLRADLPQLRADPLLPHKAAAQALNRARARHIPYDFTMDYRDRTKLFCSEVASAAYEPLGVNLWMGVSHISSPVVVAWLSCFGARHFETQEPSDLEYDPQLRVVAEWRDPATLWQDHADNAVIDAMLEGAGAGERLGYAWYLLPLSRIAKGFSVILNAFGRPGPIPEGMSATAALRHKKFSRDHRAIKEQLLVRAAQFNERNGYAAPYWELVRLARTAQKEYANAGP